MLFPSNSRTKSRPASVENDVKFRAGTPPLTPPMVTEQFMPLLYIGLSVTAREAKLNAATTVGPGQLSHVSMMFAVFKFAKQEPGP